MSEELMNLFGIKFMQSDEEVHRSLNASDCLNLIHVCCFFINEVSIKAMPDRDMMKRWKDGGEGHERFNYFLFSVVNEGKHAGGLLVNQIKSNQITF